MDNAGTIPQRAKKVLKELYFQKSPLNADELTIRLGEKNKIVVLGNPGLGGFGKKFLKKLNKDFPTFQFPQPYSGASIKNNNAFIQVFLDLFQDKKNGTFYFCLRSRCRVALKQCFGDTTISNW